MRRSYKSQNVTNGHTMTFGVTLLKLSVFQTYISYMYMYDHGLRVTDMTVCVGIDPPGRTSQSKAATLSIEPPALSFCTHVIPSLCIDLNKSFGCLAWDMKLGCSVSKCDETLHEGGSWRTLRESHGGLPGNRSPSKGVVVNLTLVFLTLYRASPYPLILEPLPWYHPITQLRLFFLVNTI